MKALLILVTVYSAAVADNTSYNGYKVFRAYPKNIRELKTLKMLSAQSVYDFWLAPNSVETPTTVMVPPSHQKIFTDVLKSSNIKYTLLIGDVKRSVIAERKRQKSHRRLNKGSISFDSYHRYQVIQDYLLKLAEDYPDIVSVENIGTSYENRTMHMIKIGERSCSKPIILIEGGIHAREWISPAFVTYLIHELVENKNNRHMIETANWFIIPVLNPDGYEYTHTDDRFWRKTRSVGHNCIGVDANRNFDYHWMEAGVSSNECSNTYGGPSAFSEPEVAALRDVVNRYKKQMKLYLTFHSYGQYILYPWCYTSNPPDDVDEIKELGLAANDGIASVFGTTYKVNNVVDELYAAAGGSIDWIKGVGGVELSYTLELPGGGAEGLDGFELPASEILNVCNETFEGIKVFHRYIENKFPNI